MEYFNYDYKNVKTEINFSNYENFVFSRRTYKYYLFDLGLLRYDPLVKEEYKQKAKDVIKKQKFFIFLPYCVFISTLIYKMRTNFFQVGMLGHEFKLIFNLCMFTIGVRIFQKALLKYEGDKILLEISKNKAHSV